MIEIFSEDVDFPAINNEEVNKWLVKVIEGNNRTTGDISIIFCSDCYLLRINQEYLKHDYYTDIITFNYCEKEVISGDLFISIDTVQSNSEKYNVTFQSELHRVIVHGILHLIGFNDKTEMESKEMRNAENQSLSLYKTFE
ncbi:rRNA maturation RNase YbeY [Marinilabiliaceae bacterium JC017]|nr:rRNA maturation RNase YbeY [Marinilabiliaceae bacterium JC017]